LRFFFAGGVDVVSGVGWTPGVPTSAAGGVTTPVLASPLGVDCSVGPSLDVSSAAGSEDSVASEGPTTSRVFSVPERPKSRRSLAIVEPCARTSLVARASVSTSPLMSSKSSGGRRDWALSSTRSMALLSTSMIGETMRTDQVSAHNRFRKSLTSG
jgi:hypothetical protein